MKEETLYQENVLLLRVANGDEQAFKILVNQNSDLLGSFIFKYTHSRERAEEIVQDVFIKIWTIRETLSEIKDFRSWMFILAKHQTINAIKKALREKQLQKEWAVLQGTTESTQEIPQEKENKYDIIDRAINALPPQQKKAFILNRKKKLKYKEVAETMEVSPETVKKYIHYAMVNISRYVETHPEIFILFLFLLKNKKN